MSVLESCFGLHKTPMEGISAMAFTYRKEEKKNPNCLRKIYNLNNKKCYSLSLPNTFGTRCWGSAYGWVALVDHNFDLQLFNPITKACLSFPNVGLLHTNNDDETDETDVGEDYISWFLVGFVVRLIVLKVSHDGYVIVINSNNYDDKKSLAFARHGDQSWTTISVEEISREISEEIGDNRVVDIAAIDDTVFALCKDGSVIYWGVKDFNDLKLIKPRYYLRTCVDIMVLRFKEQISYSDDSADTDDEENVFYKTVGFQVYKLEPKDKRWVKIDDLGEVAMFVGVSSSMCVAVKHAQGVQRNCIYFTDDECQFWGLPMKRAGLDMGVYNYKDDKLRRFYKGEGMLSSFCPPIFFIPQF